MMSIKLDNSIKRGKIKLTIIIVNWNTRGLLEKCLNSIYSNPPSCTYEVYVIDNASTDGSPEMIGNKFSGVNLIKNEENLGFARANNQGIKVSSGSLILLLNSDTEVKTNSLDVLVQFMEEHAIAGGAGARLLNPDGSLQYSCSPAPTLWGEFQRLFHLPGRRADGYYSMADWNQDTPREVDILIGACLILRRKALDQIGLLDEKYFMYSEEVDLCYRLWSAGWHLFWVPAATVVHHGGQSTQQVAPDMFLQLYESKVIYFRNNRGPLVCSFYKLILAGASLARLAVIPFTRLEKRTKRQRYLRLANNYRRLLGVLPRI